MVKVKYTNVSGISVEDFLKSFKVAKTLLYKIKQNKLIEINGEKKELTHILALDDVLTIDVTSLEVDKISNYKANLEVIYEDEDLLIVDKPTGILVHSDGSDNKTLNNIVSNYYETSNQDLRVRHSHRLDYGTSGIVVYAKNIFASSFLNYQIETGSFKKYYTLLVEGKIKEDSGVINQRIGKNRHLANRYLVSSSGKEAITIYNVVARFNNKTLVEAEILTGRRHQIRVHFAYLGHPIVGDEYYGTKNRRLMLHANKVAFIHPRTKKEIIVQSNLPKEFNIGKNKGQHF